MKNVFASAICAVLICVSASFAVYTRADREPYNLMSAGKTDAEVRREIAGAEIKADTKPYSWYCRHRKDGLQPEPPAEMSFISKWDAYYIDTSHGDKNNEKVIYLTFDAGYENGNISKILDVMAEKNVKGAFFILEHLIKNDTELVKRMADEGHTVCNHTSSHRDMSAVTNKDAFYSELKSLEETYKSYTGKALSHFYRPPEGRFSEANLKAASELGYKTVLWSFAYADWDNNNQMSADSALDKILGGVHNGEIILLHPTSKTNAEILPELIDRLRDMGYRFGTLDEIGTENNA